MFFQQQADLAELVHPNIAHHFAMLHDQGKFAMIMCLISIAAIINRISDYCVGISSKWKFEDFSAGNHVN